MAAARFIVHGKVQGVWFRASTRDVAVRLGIVREEHSAMVFAV